MEYFSAKDAPATDGGFTVELARSGKSVQVRAGQTILDSLIEIGVEPPYSCQEGVCGTCEVRVLAGTPDHRDLVLSAAERAANDRIMVCCSGARSARLVLDL
jgi:vanillate O-demethylase ferredoxin subunit